MDRRPIGRRVGLFVIVAAIFVVALVWWRVTAPQAEPGPADARWSWVLPEDPKQLQQFRAKVLERKSRWAADNSGMSLGPAGK